MAGTNPIASWLLSNFTTQEPGAYKSAIDGNAAVAQRFVDCFAPRQSNTPAMTVTLDAGHLFNGAALIEVAAQTTGTITAPASDPRIDRVVIDNLTGGVSVVTGAENASPTAPAIPTGKSPVAQVLLQTSSTVITNAMITDERNLSALTTRFFVGSATRDVSTATGSQAITGVGFKPKAVIIFGSVNATTKASLGFGDGTTNICLIGNAAGVAGNFSTVATAIAAAVTDASNNSIAALSSLDSDGFTLGWTKTGTPTGTFTFGYIALR